MPTTLIALLSFNENDPVALGEYLRITMPLLDRAKARILKRFPLNQAIVGKGPAQVALIVEFPDLAAVEALSSSSEYQQAIPFRDRAFLKYKVSFVADNEALPIEAERA